MAGKENFLSFRADDLLFGWVKKYASKNNISVSDVIREALFALKCKKDSDETGESISCLQSEVGYMFRFVKTESGMMLERVKPGVVNL